MLIFCFLKPGAFIIIRLVCERVLVRVLQRKRNRTSRFSIKNRTSTVYNKYLYLYLYLSLYIYMKYIIHTHICTCINAYMQIDACPRMYVNINIHVCIYLHTCICRERELFQGIDLCDCGGWQVQNLHGRLEILRQELMLQS